MPKISEVQRLKEVNKLLREETRLQRKTIASLEIKMEKLGTDPITGLSRYNEVQIEKMKQIINRAERHTERFEKRQEISDNFVAVFYFDLDDLKWINDRYGHAAGNAALRTFAKSIGKELRGYDPFVRIGGDEFIVLMTIDSSPNKEKLKSLMMRFRKSLAENPLEFDGGKISLEVSIGYDSYDYRKTIEENIKVVDKLMYDDKKKRKAAKTK